MPLIAQLSSTPMSCNDIGHHAATDIRNGFRRSTAVTETWQGHETSSNGTVTQFWDMATLFTPWCGSCCHGAPWQRHEWPGTARTACRKSPRRLVNGVLLRYQRFHCYCTHRRSMLSSPKASKQSGISSASESWKPQFERSLEKTSVRFTRRWDGKRSLAGGWHVGERPQEHGEEKEEIFCIQHCLEL